MKIKVKPHEAFILYQALNARISTLKIAEKNNRKLAQQVQTTLSLRDRLFPAPVVIPDEEDA